MPLGIEGSDETLHDGLVTALATRGIVVIVTLPAEGLAVLLVETICAKLLSAQCAEEVLRMPSLVQGSHHSLEGRGGEKRRVEG